MMTMMRTLALGAALLMSGQLATGPAFGEQYPSKPVKVIVPFPAGGVTDITKLPYARMVLAEAMRLYPPTWMFVRVAQRDDVLPTGAFVAAGSKIYLSQWVMHRNPRWFPEPERFDPRRFTSDAIKARPRLAYLPFGAGRRLCLGEDFAWMQGVLMLAAVARRFRLTLAPGQTVEPEPNVTLRPKGGLAMRVARR